MGFWVLCPRGTKGSSGPGWLPRSSSVCVHDTQPKRRPRFASNSAIVANPGETSLTGWDSGRISTVSESFQRRIMTYDYVCTACAHVWEAEQRISEEPLTDCPECQQATAKRQISGGQGFILKGGGWYSDLYSSSSSNSSKPAAAADSAKESKPDKPASGCASGACGTSACPAAAAT